MEAAARLTKQMPKFKVDADSSHNAKDTFSKIRNFLEQAEDLKKIDPGIVCTFDEAKLKGYAKGKQFKADISILQGTPEAKVSIEIEIPFLLSPFKTKIQESLERKLKKALA